MDVSLQDGGRARQKARTREAVVAATRQLLRDGVTPTVEQAADAARVSRTTAYRYFPSQRALLAATFPQLEGGSLLGDHPPADVRARVALFAEKMTKSILANEAEMRAMLRLSLEPQVPLHEVALRQGRRTIWVADALAPLHGSMTRSRFEQLTLAIAAAAGIESFVWLVDVGGVDRTTAAAILKSTCIALLEHELHQCVGDG
jgi:AcrR family transcriptional regulator